MDIPLLHLLGSKVPELLPYPEVYANWEEWIGSVLLLKSARQVMPRSGDKTLETLTWGDINKVYIGHPFSQAFPFLRHLLDMPEAALADCDLCVRLAIPIGGASERLVGFPRQGARWYSPHARWTIQPPTFLPLPGSAASMG